MKAKIGQLADMCEKLFIFIDEEERLIPLSTVKRLQKFGKKIKWTAVEIDLPTDFQVYLSFFVGKTHERTASDVEFIFLSEGAQFDSLVHHINAFGRSCLRLEPSRAAELLETPPLPSTGEREKEPHPVAEPSESGEPASREKTDIQPGKIAQEVVQRMVRSGNRPSELSNLREYIQTCCHPGIGRSHVDHVIQCMEESKEIVVTGGTEVVYNF